MAEESNDAGPQDNHSVSARLRWMSSTSKSPNPWPHCSTYYRFSLHTAIAWDAAGVYLWALDRNAFPFPS